MNIPIPPVSAAVPAAIAPSAAVPSGATAGGAAFSSLFADAINKVEGFQQNAQASVDRFLNGEGEELHTVALKTQQADLSFQLFMQVRNKIVAAYQEVMRMQV
jgi:flagellar hook-basal body complex protein FliE